MFITDIKRVVEQVSREKGLERQVLVAALKDAIISAIKKRFGPKMDVEVNYNENLGEFEVYQFKTIVEKVRDPDTEISLDEAKELDPESEMSHLKHLITNIAFLIELES